MSDAVEASILYAGLPDSRRVSADAAESTAPYVRAFLRERIILVEAGPRVVASVVVHAPSDAVSLYGAHDVDPAQEAGEREEEEDDAREEESDLHRCSFLFRQIRDHNRTALNRQLLPE